MAPVSLLDQSLSTIQGGSEGFATEAGSSTWGAMKKLRGLVRGKLAGDNDGEHALALLEAEPPEAQYVSELAARLTRLMAVDSGFADDLTKLVEEAQKDPASQAIFGFATDRAKQVNIGRDNFGDITF